MKLKSFFYIVLFLISISSYSQEAKKIDSLKAEILKSKTEQQRADFYMLLIDNYFSTQKDSAEVYLKKTLKLTDNEELRKTYIHAILKYAQFYIVKGNYPEAQKYYDLAWKKLENNYDYSLYNKYYGDLGVLNFYKGNFKGALENFNKALKLAEKENNEVDVLRYLNNKALAMSYLGEAEASLDVHKKAIEIAEKINDSTALGKSFNNIGLIYEDMKEHQKALEFYLQALEIKKNGKSKVDVANSLFNVAGMYKEIGLEKKDTTYFKKAEDFYKKSVEVANQVNYGKIILLNNNGLAQLASARNQPRKAIDIYTKVIDEAKEINDNETLRNAYLNIGKNYLKINNLKNAETYLKLAESSIQEGEKLSEMGSLYENLSNLYSSKKEYEKAYTYLKKQQQIDTELAKNSLQNKISDFEVKYETAKKEKEIAQQKEELLEKELAIQNRNLYAILLASALLILGIIFFAIYKKNQFKRKQLQKEIDLKDALATIKTQNRLQEQRLKISRDLHDNIGSQLTFIISSIDNLKFVSKDANETLKEKLANISSFTGDTIHQLRDTIWAMNKSEISIEDLHARVLSFIEKAKKAVPNIVFDISYDIQKNKSLSSLVGMNIFRVIQEAINNAVKYAEASKITITFFEKGDEFHATVTDNGVGFDFNKVDLGNGLSNMEKRMSEIGGKLNITTNTTKGTEIHLRTNIKDSLNIN